MMKILFALCLSFIVFMQPVSAGEEFNPTLGKASDDGENAIKTFKYAKELKCELFAAEPMAANLVCLYVDNSGKVYIVETFRFGTAVDTNSSGLTVEQDLALRTFDDRVNHIKTKFAKELDRFHKDHERIRVLEDTTGSGKANKVTLYSDDFSGISDGIMAGVLPFRGDVFVACIPDVWKLTDKDGDGKADEKKSLSHGYGVHGGYLGHDLHGLVMGPDRKIYVTIGDRGSHIEIEGKVFDNPDWGCTFRFNPDGSEFEVFATGLRNPQELAFDDFGNLFTGDNNSDGGDQARWVHILEGSDAGWRQGYQYLPNRGPWNVEKLWKPQFKGQAAYHVPPIANYVNGPSGLAYYPGVGLPERYKGHFFLSNFSGGQGNSGVVSFGLKPKGASFEMTDAHQFFWNQLATDCDFGPDGALYVSDWINGWGKPNKGRVYKVYDPALKNDPLVLESKKLLAEGFAKRGNDELAKLLGHAHSRVRQEAQFALEDKGAEVIGLLEGIAAKSDSQFARAHAIWALEYIGRKSPEALKTLPALLAEKDYEIRAQAAKMLGDRKVSAAAAQLIALLKDENARVRSIAAIALGKIGTKEALDPLLAMLKENGDEDPALRHAGVMGLVAQPLEALLAKASDASPAARMGILLALRRHKSPEVARFLKDADPLLAAEAARAINDVPIPEAYPALAALLQPDDAKKEAGPAKFKIEYWMNFQGNLESLKKSPDFPGKPTNSEELTALEIPPNKADSYCSRMTGLLTAPQTGNYTFWISADDFGELYLSTDENPANKKMIANCENWAPARDWDKYPGQKSQPVALKAGQKYFVEVLHKEGQGDDSCAVGWQLPDGKMQRPIGESGSDQNVIVLNRALNANFRNGKPENAKALAAFAAKQESPGSLRAEALAMLADWASPPPRDKILNLFRPLPNRDGAPAAEAARPILASILKSGSAAMQVSVAQIAAKYEIKDAGPALFDIVNDEKAAQEARVEALKTLVALKDKNAFAAVNRAANDKGVKLRQEGTAQRGKMNPDQAIPTFEAALKNGTTPEKQSALLNLAQMGKPAADAIISAWMDKLLAGQAPAELQLDIVESAKLNADKSVKEKLAKYETSLNPHEELAPFKIALSGGDAELGKKVFHESTTAQCLRCHKLNGQGGDVGPELAGVGTRQKREYFLESLITPSAQIAKGFEQVIIAQTDGKIITGIVKGENEKELTVMGADGTAVKVAKDQIKTRKDQKQSAMPPMGEVLTKSELRNVIEYLTTLK
jgi:putative membrane-bound dehydrogenase-like protein